MTEDSRFRIHPVKWTRSKSARFWDYISSRPAFREIYFSRLVGDSVVKLVKRNGARLKGEILDFGCGPGYLVESLLRNGVAAEGADFSADSVQLLRDRLAENALFRGAHVLDSIPSSLPSERYDVVFFVETIEHLLDEDLSDTIAEIRRILKPGGQIIVTTPNDEDLDKNECLCPDCGASFHRIQHVRQWTAESLTSYLRLRGFERVAIRKTFFRPSSFGTFVFSVAARLRRRKLPNLVYIGRKSL
jgi:2-polyprenyl-3-methyl-5-hydroxy-6-metoxy-1,4-benzoquinol methylase